MATKYAVNRKIPASSPKSSTGYGCTREVLHALDPGAESGAIVIYETDSETESRIKRPSGKQVSNKFETLGQDDIPNLDQGATVREIVKTLESYKTGDVSPSYASLRLKALIEQLRSYNEALTNSEQVSWVCAQLIPHTLTTENATILKGKCVAPKHMENWPKIMTTWLMHWAIYSDEKDDENEQDTTVYYENIVIDYNPKPVTLAVREIKPNVADLVSTPRKPKQFSQAKLARLNDIKTRATRETESLKDAEHEREKRFVEEVQLQVFKEEAANYASLVKSNQPDLLNEKILEYRNKLQAQENERAVAYQKELERKRKEEERRREKERIEQENRVAQEKARVQEQQRVEEAKRLEAARAAEAKKEEERRAAEAREQSERRQREQEQQKQENAKKAEQATAAEAGQGHQAQAQQSSALVQAPPPAQPVVPTQYGRKTFEADRALFSRLLKNLDRVEERMKAETMYAKQLAPLRRKLNMLGRLTSENDQITLVRDAIINSLTEVSKIPGPTERAADFQRDALVDASSEVVPLGFIWVLDHLARNAVTILEQESSIKSELANPIGIVITAVLSRDLFQVNGKSFIEIVVARLWEKCPILQGIMGPEETEDQKLAHGWARNGTEWETSESHINRMVSYCSGFAAIAGRYFGHAARPAPYPMHNLWFLLAHMCQNADALGDTHFYAIKGILSTAGNNMRRQYGHQADKLGRLLLVEVCNVGLGKRLSGAFACYAFRKDIMNLKRYPD